MRHAVIVTAAGYSCRFNEKSDKSQKKEFMKINGHSMLYQAVEPFTDVDGLCAVVITYQKNTVEETKSALETLPEKCGIPFFFVEGGETRQKSVFNALNFLYGINDELKTDYVSIHDGARPYITKELIGITLAAAVNYGGAAPAIQERDTLVMKNSEGFISGRVDRTGVCRIQTPQIFEFSEIYEAHRKAIDNPQKSYTDDTEIFNDFEKSVFLVEGDPKNIKITYRKDLC